MFLEKGHHVKLGVMLPQGKELPEASLEQSRLCYLEREAGPSDILVFAFWPPDL